jgi:hypothetical protein
MKDHQKMNKNYPKKKYMRVNKVLYCEKVKILLIKNLINNYWL